jgi:ankyrin repeat protein
MKTLSLIKHTFAQNSPSEAYTSPPTIEASTLSSISLTDFNIPSLQSLARRVAPLPFLELPLELQVAIFDFMDLSTRIALAETCTSERSRYTSEQRNWLIFKRDCLLHINKCDNINDIYYERSDEFKLLEHYYYIALSHLLPTHIPAKDYKEVTLLVEKFFNYLDMKIIKKQLNRLLAAHPAYPWQAIFEKIAGVNLHLCVTLITRASPNFDPAMESFNNNYEQENHYPFTELYPFLIDRLQFGNIPISPFGWWKGSIKNNLILDTRAQEFFYHIRVDASEYNTALHFAATEGYIDIVPALVNGHDCINLSNELGNTALISCMLSLEAAPINVINTLLQLNANPNIQNKKGNTALFYALARNDLDATVIFALLNAGANVNLANKAGETPLMQAVMYKANTAIIRALLKAGAKVNIQDRYGSTALTHSIGTGLTNTLHILLKHNPDINLPDNKGRTALMQAVIFVTHQRTVIETVKLLLNYGADKTIVDHEGKNALFFAKSKNHQALIDLLENP